MTPAMVSGDAVYFSARDHYVYVLERDTGALRWRTYFKRYSQTTPLLIEDRLYIASQNHQVYALDPTTGTLAGEPLLETPRHVDADWTSDGGRIYLGDCEGHIYALSIRVPPVETDPAPLGGVGSMARGGCTPRASPATLAERPRFAGFSLMNLATRPCCMSVGTNLARRRRCIYRPASLSRRGGVFGQPGISSRRPSFPEKLGDGGGRGPRLRRCRPAGPGGPPSRAIGAVGAGRGPVGESGKRRAGPRT